MLQDNMDLSRLMVHPQQVEENRPKRIVYEGKKPKTVDKTGSRSGRGSFGVKNGPMFKKHLGNSFFSGNSNVKVNKFCPKKGHDRIVR